MHEYQTIYEISFKKSNNNFKIEGHLLPSISRTDPGIQFIMFFKRFSNLILGRTYLEHTNTIWSSYSKNSINMIKIGYWYAVIPGIICDEIPSKILRYSWSSFQIKNGKWRKKINL